MGYPGASVRSPLLKVRSGVAAPPVYPTVTLVARLRQKTVYARPGAAWVARRWHLIFAMLCFVYLYQWVEWDMSNQPSVFAHRGLLSLIIGEVTLVGRKLVGLQPPASSFQPPASGRQQQTSGAQPGMRCFMIQEGGTERMGQPM